MTNTPGSASPGVAGRTVLVAGATSAAGIAVTAALSVAGARVVAVGSNADRLQALRDQAPEAITHVCDLSSFAAVRALADTLRADSPRDSPRDSQRGGQRTIDGLIHLVGGWRGGGGLAGQSDEDWEVLHRNIVTTLRNTTRAFNDDLLASPAGRLAMVSSASVDKPTPGGANYAAAKSAAETWTRAVGRGFARAGRDDSASGVARAAAVIFVVRSLDGLEAELAAAIVGLWDADAASVNNSRMPLGP